MTSNKFDLMILGSAGGIPTEERSLPSYVIDLGGRYIMLDCGEGTFRRFRQARLSTNKEMIIIISHYDPDHYLGLATFINGLSLLGRNKKLTIYTPKIFASIWDTVTYASVVGLGSNLVDNPRLKCKAFIENHIDVDKLKFQIEYNVLEETHYTINKLITIHAMRNNHRTPESFAFRIEELLPDFHFDAKKALKDGVPEGKLMGKLARGHDIEIETNHHVMKDGKPEVYKEKYLAKDYMKPNTVKPRVICYSGDTTPFKNSHKLFHDADILLHDCTYMKNDLLLSLNYKHSTTVSAVRTARKSKVRYLLLTHISNKSDPVEMLKEAIFENNRYKKDKPEISLVEDLDVYGVNRKKHEGCNGQCINITYYRKYSIKKQDQDGRREEKHNTKEHQS